MTLEEKENILLMATYSAKEVSMLTGACRASVTTIMNKCKDLFGGAVKYRNNVITAKSFWEYQGTTIEEEYRLLGIAKGYVVNE